MLKRRQPAPSTPGQLPAFTDAARQQLTRWCLDHGCPELQIRRWMTVVGTPAAWTAFLRRASDDDIAVALEAAARWEA